MKTKPFVYKKLRKNKIQKFECNEEPTNRDDKRLSDCILKYPEIFKLFK